MSNLIRQRRQVLGLTQKELAYLVLLSPKTISRYEREGISDNVTINNKIIMLSRVLGISLDDLLNIGGVK